MGSVIGICPFCKFDWDSPIESLQSSLRSAGQRFSSVISKASDEELRARPSTKVWSALEYTAHTRDGVGWYTDRINRTLVEESPRLAGRDWERETEIRRYHEEATPDVLSGLSRTCEALANLLSSLSLEDWKRQAIGSEGDRRDVLLLARRATHETEHHCLDAANSLLNLDRSGRRYKTYE